MVNTRATANMAELLSDEEQLRADELAMAQERARAAGGEDIPPFPSERVATASSEATLPTLLSLIANMQLELREIRSKRRDTDSDSEGDDRDAVLMSLNDRYHVLTPADLRLLTYGNLLPAVCHDPRFCKALDYRYYRLHKRSNQYDAHVAAKIARLTRQMEASFKLRFDGSDSLSILQFLQSFTEAANSNGVREGAALYVLRSFLDSPAREEFTAYKPAAFPVAVDWLLTTFAPVSALAAEYKAISSLIQTRGESPREFSLRLRQRASRLGPLMDEAAVTILLEGLDPSLSGFVQSALRNQKPTFTSVIQEAELVYTSVKAAEQRMSDRSQLLESRSSRPLLLTRNRELRPHRESTTPAPVLTAEVPSWYDAEFPEHLSEAVDPGLHASEVQNMDHVLVAHLAHPQQVRYCYTCWRPGHFSAECPLIPEPERAAIALRRSEIMKQRDRKPPYGRGPVENRTNINPMTRPSLGVSSVATPASSSQGPSAAVEELKENDQLAENTRLCESQ